MTTAMVPHDGNGDIFTPDGFATTLKIADAFVKSGILPRGIDTAYKAFAIIQKGREIGVGPMRALTGIHLIEGKPVVSPELKLEQFRERGGRLKWVRSDATVAELWLKAPNGDEHTEIVTIEDMRAAGVASKDNWRKYPKSMLRARAVGFGLRALGEGDGSYTPDELGAVTDEGGNVQYEPPASPLASEARSMDAEFKGVASEPGPKATPGASAASPITSGSAGQVSTTKPPTANKIAWEFPKCSPEQVKLIHVLRGKFGGKFAGPDDDARSAWRKALGAYKDADGKPITTSPDLSKGQATHLIDRMKAAAAKQAETHAKLEAEAPENLQALGGSRPANDNLPDALTDRISSDDEEARFFAELGFADRGAVGDGFVADVLACLMAWNTPAWPEVRDKARAKWGALGWKNDGETWR